VNNRPHALSPIAAARREARLLAKQAEVQAELARRGFADGAVRAGSPPLRACAGCGAEFRSHAFDRCRHCRGYAHTRTGGRP